MYKIKIATCMLLSFLYLGILSGIGISHNYIEKQKTNLEIVDQSKLSSRSKLVLSKEVRTDLYSLCVPDDWQIRQVSDLIEYRISKGHDSKMIGKTYPVEYHFTPEGYNPDPVTSILPNHRQINKALELKGFFTDCFMYNITTSNPAASSDQSTHNMTYIIFVDRNKSNSEIFTAYVLYFDNAYLSEEDAAKIAGSFRLLNWDRYSKYKDYFIIK